MFGYPGGLSVFDPFIVENPEPFGHPFSSYCQPSRASSRRAANRYGAPCPADYIYPVHGHAGCGGAQPMDPDEDTLDPYAATAYRQQRQPRANHNRRSAGRSAPHHLTYLTPEEYACLSPHEAAYLEAQRRAAAQQAAAQQRAAAAAQAAARQQALLLKQQRQQQQQALRQQHAAALAAQRAAAAAAAAASQSAASDSAEDEDMDSVDEEQCYSGRGPFYQLPFFYQHPLHAAAQKQQQPRPADTTAAARAGKAGPKAAAGSSVRVVPVTSASAAASSSSGSRSSSCSYAPPTPVQAPASAPASAAKQQQHAVAASKPQLSRTAAATRIQAFWRMYRLARYHKMLKTLVAISASTQALSAKFTASKEASQGVLTHKQYLELSEGAMRLLLQLDATSCGAPELRQVRKRLTTAAIQLLDSIQAAYSSAVRTASNSEDDHLTHKQQEQQQVGAGVDDNPGSSSSKGGQAQAAATSSEQLPAGGLAEEMELDEPAAGTGPTAAAEVDAEQVEPPQASTVAKELKQQQQQEVQQQEQPTAAVAVGPEDGCAQGAAGCLEEGDSNSAAGSTTPEVDSGEGAAAASPCLDTTVHAAAGSAATPSAGAAGHSRVAGQLGSGGQQVVGQHVGPAQGVRVVLLYPGQACVVTSQ